MSILAGFMVPHPPLIIPQVGKGSEEQVRKTITAYEKVAQDIADLRPETILISSPHAVMYSDYFHISPGKGARGSFSQFGARNVSFDETYDTDLVKVLELLAAERGFPAGTLGERDRELDHGTMVPLHFIRQKYNDFRLVRIGLSGLPLTDHYRLGQMIREAVSLTGRRAVYVASGDLSHKMQYYGPYGFAKEGPEYDERLMDVCGRAAFGELLEFDETFCEKAAECGHRSFVIMAGAFDCTNVEARVLSHEDVTGVGYGICEFFPKEDSAESTEGAAAEEAPERNFLDQYLAREAAQTVARKEAEDPYVRLARASLESYIRDHKRIGVPADLPAEMLDRRAGVFVSIHEHQRLRGCIGTIAPVTGSVAEEILRNAISASTEDPRFEPITKEELDFLEINVDVLGEPERISSLEELDVKRYGVIVSKGRRRGLLLPDLDGVDTPEQQVAIARRKAGIDPDEDVELERFEVIRHR